MPAEPPYVDDPTIHDDVDLWRRIPKGQYVLDPKAETGLRPSSGAFDDSSDGPMSASIADAERVPLEAASGGQSAGLVSISVRLLRSLGQGIVRDPTPEDLNHVLVFGPKPKSYRGKVAKAARWVVRPPR
jgi:hypothetical protein